MKIKVDFYTKRDKNHDFELVKDIPDTISAFTMLAEKGIVLRIGDSFGFARSDVSNTTKKNEDLVTEDSLTVEGVYFVPGKGLERFKDYDMTIDYYVTL